MRIVLWYWGRRGGGAQFALGLARALAQRPDIQPRLALSAQCETLPAFQALDVPIALTGTYRNRVEFVTALPRIPAVTAALVTAAAGADAVVSAMTHLWTPLVAPALPRAGIAFVPVVHDAKPHPGDPGFAWNWRLGRELRAARAAVALSSDVAAALTARAPALPLIRMRLPALIDAPGPRPARAGPPRFLFFGRLRAYKGLDVLRDAFTLLRQRHPDVTLRVVGEGDAAACAPGLTTLPGVTLEQRWVAEGEIPALLAACDAVVLPYREASQSGVVPQALAMGVPVVATPVGGLVEQVRAGEGGVLAGSVTAAAFAAAMARLLEPGALPRLQAEAASAGRAATDWDAAAEQLVAGLRARLR